MVLVEEREVLGAGKAVEQTVKRDNPINREE